MKYQCEACERLVPVEAFRIEDGVLSVTCRACGARTLAAPSASASQDVSREGGGGRGGSDGVAMAVPTAEAFTSPQPVPPRSSIAALRVVRSDAPSSALDGDPFQAPPGHCPKCVAPMRGDEGACAQCGLVYANFLPDEHLPSGALATGWRALLQTWDDDEAHERLLTLAVERGELAMAGRLYRLRLARTPGDARALRGRDEVVRRVTSVVPLASDGPSPELARKVKNTVMGAVLIVALVLVLVLFQMLRGSF